MFESQPIGELMAKTQKTLVLNDDLCRVVQAFADHKGTTFTKIVTGALLEFLFHNHASPDMDWVGLGVSLDKGDITIVGAPVTRLEGIARKYELLADDLRRTGQSQKAAAYEMEYVKAIRDIAAKWRHDIDRMGGGVEGVMARLTRSTVQGAPIPLQDMREQLDDEDKKRR